MALLPPFFLDTVVAIGAGGDPAKRRWIGTGFLFGKLITPVVDAQQRSYSLWLITNKHVLESFEDVYVKFNSAAEPNSKDYRVALIADKDTPLWVGHPNDNIDVAAILLDADFLKQESRRFAVFQSDQHTCSKETMKTGVLNEGDRVFVLGFPMGLVAPERQYVICRSGSIARIRDYLEDKATDFLVDAPGFPGNSGGPVISCPSASMIAGTKHSERAELIGIAKSFIPYVDVAISSQTKRPRVTFEENSGLTSVESAESILQTVSFAGKRLNRRAQAKFQATERVQTEFVGSL
ncbi:MAG: S1 family peptidase [Gammaproteobacteria bacterium]